ncbi:MAG: DNA/RNA non-specific endonuclease [Bryobacterales bacterium]|nr:DNA/RNA non-specific endonuclease [Bryobacterales bacterium]
MLVARYFLPLLLISSLAAQTGRFGLPACASTGEEIADRTYFVLCHNSSRKVPVWVGYELKPEHLTQASVTRTRFRRDPLLTQSGAEDSDYTYSGYSRGHMAPAADFAWSAEAFRATFLLSNAAPQLQSVNAGPWARLENAVRRLARSADRIYVFTGPIFDHDSNVIGEGRVAVPTHFFKAVLVEHDGHRTVYGAVVPNSPTGAEPLSNFFVSIREIETRTGLDFFSALDDQQERLIESRRQPWSVSRP